ncbi:hypothetical protein bcgnr5380_05810 [Bacillus cereus]
MGVRPKLRRINGKLSQYLKKSLERFNPIDSTFASPVARNGTIGIHTKITILHGNTMRDKNGTYRILRKILYGEK